jgi:hypothetical protein
MDTTVIRVSVGKWFLRDERFPRREGSISSKIPENGTKSKSTMEQQDCNYMHTQKHM